MTSEVELPIDPIKRLRRVLAAFVLLPVIMIIGQVREISAGTASGPFHGKIPLVLYTLCLVAWPVIIVGIKGVRKK